MENVSSWALSRRLNFGRLYIHLSGDGGFHLPRRTAEVVNAWSADSWMLLSTTTPMIARMTAATQANKNAFMMTTPFCRQLHSFSFVFYSDD
jgi:hypothetical protein